MFILIDGVSGDKSLAYIGAGRLMNMRLNQNYCENNQIVFGMEDVIIFGIFFVISIGLAVFTRKKIYKYYTKT